MLLTTRQRKKLRWLKRFDDEKNSYSVGHYHFISDGTETKEDVETMIWFADTWLDLNGERIVDNYEELTKRLEKLNDK